MTIDTGTNDEAAGLQNTYERQRQTMESHVADLEAAATSLLLGSLEEEERSNAIRHAHKVAGSAGMFGYSRASRVAREIELSLADMDQTKVDPDLPRRIAELTVELRDAIEIDPKINLDEDEDSASSADADEVSDKPMSVWVMSNDRGVMNKIRAKVHRGETNVKVFANSDVLQEDLKRAHPDLVVLDTEPIEGSDSDYQTLCQNLRANDNLADVALILILSSEGNETAKHTFDLGADDYLIKPLNDDDILLRIGNRIERRRAHFRMTEGKTLDKLSSNLQPPNQQTTSNSTTPNDASSTFDIVLVEDDEALAPLLLHTFRTRGLTAAHIDSGSEAVKMLTGPSPSIYGRIVVLDWDLPGQNGLSVLRIMANDGTLQRTFVIMLTGRSSEGDVVSALELGASDHIAKPFSVSVLMQRIQRLLPKAGDST